ncbi:helix-turn-helix transcriptional regulator [Flammeovirga yaeyamensis]|nr:helix-turn-helix transcriptional regulator [Flammeovirga yaeyamensis]
MKQYLFSFEKEINSESIMKNLKHFDEYQHVNNHFWGKGKQGEIDIWWYDDFESEFQIIVFNMSLKEDFHFLDDQKDFDSITFRFFLNLEVVYDQLKIGKENHSNVVVYNSKRSVHTTVPKNQKMTGVTFRITKSFIKKLTKERWDQISDIIGNSENWMIHETLSLEMDRILKDIIILQSGIEGKYGLTLSKSIELITYLLIQIVHHRSNQKAFRIDDDLMVELFKIKDQLLDNLMDPPPITELSQEYGMNIGKLRNNFKKVFGSSPHQFIINERLIEARRLVKNTKMSMSEISDLTGFTDSSHFSKEYRKKYAIAPLKDRKDKSKIL